MVPDTRGLRDRSDKHAPAGPFAHLDILKEDAAAALVLQLHQLLSMFPLFMGLVKEIFGKVLQSHIIAVKVVRLYVEREHVKLGAGCAPGLNLTVISFYLKTQK